MELALCLPLLMALTLGICELGEALKVEAILSEAARNACAAGCRPGSSNSDVISDAQDILAANRISTSSVTVTIRVNDLPGSVLTAKVNDKISVTVSVPLSQISWISSRKYLGSGGVLSQTVTMLRQG